jgi:hypothetical protein
MFENNKRRNVLQFFEKLSDNRYRYLYKIVQEKSHSSVYTSKQILKELSHETAPHPPSAGQFYRIDITVRGNFVNLIWVIFLYVKVTVKFYCLVIFILYFTLIFLISNLTNVSLFSTVSRHMTSIVC